MKNLRSKAVITFLLMISMCKAVYGASAAGSGGAAAGGFGTGLGGLTVDAPSAGSNVPGNVAMPTVPNAPSTGTTPNISTPNQGIDFSGVDAIQRELNNAPENVDLTRGDALLETNRTRTQDTQNAEGLTQGVNFDAEASEAEINSYFDQILFSRSAGSPMSTLMRRLPRFGMSFFRRPPSTYAPMDNVPVTQDYRIGVGDEITLTLWGIPEEGNFRVIVNRDGMATIPHIGAVRLAGYTLAEAERIISARLNQYYTGYQMNLSMGRLRSIMVYVTGNAARPGAYTVSSFATLVNALLASGGPNANGTLRKIELKRNGRTITVFDMYAMLLQGDKSQDTRLEAGDVIYIPPVGPLVGLAGEVQTPGIYELNGATRVKDLLYIAGGLKAQTFRGRVQFYRIYEHAYAGASEGSLDEIENDELKDGDILRMYPIYNFAATATVNGQVMRGGTFVIVPGHTRVADLVNRAGGLMVTASDQAELVRVTPSLEGPVNERFSVNIVQAMQGDPQHNLAVQQGDTLTVLVIPSWKSQIRVGIAGEVLRPGVYSMFDGDKLSDLLERAGGFTAKAFLRGAIFTRQSVAAEQREALSQMADNMERELLESMQNTGNSSNANTAANQDYQRRRQLINNLRHLDIMGRVITKVDTPANIKGTQYDYALQDGDYLRIPEVPLTVNVMGAVYSSSSQLFNPNMTINGYINAAGGAIKSAHKRMVYLLKSDGTTIRLTRSTAMLSSKQWTAPRGFTAKVEPGDTIVVPVKYSDRQALESLKDTIDVIYKVAVAAGVIIRATD
ncbi:MAG: SLBB domain-containing protein [Synergistaceae bacterium]|nr:SLBB domain-containing protein [Synergistaceae bacterium]